MGKLFIAFFTVISIAVAVMIFVETRFSNDVVLKDGTRTIGVITQHENNLKHGDKVRLNYISGGKVLEKRVSVGDLKDYPLGGFVKLSYIKRDWRNGYIIAFPGNAIMRDIKEVQYYLDSIGISMDVLSELTSQ